MRRVCRLALVLTLVAAALSAACGYALAGRGNALPTHIQLIGVPDFINHTPQPDWDRTLTDAVRKEFQTKGKYRVQPTSDGVDGALSCTISNIYAQPTAFTPDRQPSSYAIVVTASVEFKDLKDNDKVLWANPSFRVSDDYQVTTAGTATIDAAAATALFSQNVQARERLAQKFAKEVVTSIFEAF